MIGKVLGGRYEIIEKVGGGGMAIVYKAKCNLLNRYVAVKVLRDEFVSDEEFIKKFRRESQAAASLSHPNIVGIYDVGVEVENDHNIHYIVMEYIDGKTLKQLIREKGKLSFQETINYSIQIAEALEHAHKNHIIHRDIKPHNIMVTKDGRIKVTDFGIARAATSSTLTNTSNVIGSVHYFSPEQAKGRFTDEKSDIYSLGIVMYEMITGKVPFQGESPISIALKHVQEEIVPASQIDSSVPKNIEYVINKCLKKNSAERYTNANELLKDLMKIKYSNGKGEILDDTNIGDSPTRIIPVVDDETLKKNNEKAPKKAKKKKKNGNKKAVFLGILLAFLLATGLYAGFFKMKGILFNKEIEVPDLVGLNEDVAKEKIEDLGLKFKVTDREFNSEFSEGEIISQDIKPGKKLKKDYPIGVIVSKGCKLIKVPDFTNKNVSEIKSMLEEAGLEDGSREYKNSDNIPGNMIISQSPAPFTEVPEGTVVNFVISKGPKIQTISVPKLVGQNINDARNAIVASGLVLGQVSSKPSEDVPKDEVMWQSQQPGSQVEKNTSISLQISSGPQHKEKNEEKEHEKEHEKEKEEVSIMFTFNLPQDKEETEVKIIRVQDGASEVVHNKVHNANEEIVKVPIKGKPGAQLELYFDGVHQTTKQIPE